eukprot:2145057-Amphidinium_carterae.2
MERAMSLPLLDYDESDDDYGPLRSALSEVAQASRRWGKRGNGNCTKHIPKESKFSNAHRVDFLRCVIIQCAHSGLDAFEISSVHMAFGNLGCCIL